MDTVAPGIPGPSTSRSPSDGAPVAAEDDAPRLIALIVVSTVAALVVVIALIGATAIDTWWSLALVMVVHLVMTVAVFAVVAFVLSERTGRSGRRHRVPVPTGAPPAA